VRRSQLNEGTRIVSGRHAISNASEILSDECFNLEARGTNRKLSQHRVPDALITVWGMDAHNHG